MIVLCIILSFYLLYVCSTCFHSFALALSRRGALSRLSVSSIICLRNVVYVYMREIEWNMNDIHHAVYHAYIDTTGKKPLITKKQYTDNKVRQIHYPYNCFKCTHTPYSWYIPMLYGRPKSSQSASQQPPHSHMGDKIMNFLMSIVWCEVLVICGVETEFCQLIRESVTRWL